MDQQTLKPILDRLPAMPDRIHVLYTAGRLIQEGADDLDGPKAKTILEALHPGGATAKNRDSRRRAIRELLGLVQAERAVFAGGEIPKYFRRQIAQDFNDVIVELAHAETGERFDADDIEQLNQKLDVTPKEYA